MVIFQGIDHRYFFKEQEYRSVSAVFKPYETFVKEAESLRMALKALDPDWYSELSKKHGYRSPILMQEMLSMLEREEVVEMQQEILEEWTDRGQRAMASGTKFHSAMESMDIDRGGRDNPFTKEWFPHVSVRVPGYDNNSVDFLSDLGDGYYPELLLFDHDLGIAGQADMVFIKDKKAWIDDWKTDQKIDTKSFYTRRYGYTFLKDPLGNIHDTNYWRYALKISTYALMLENAGFEVAELGFTHVGGGADGNDYLYKVPYLKDDIKKVLK